MPPSSDCRLYAIPMSMVERPIKFILPDIELADGELRLTKYIADRISPKPDENHYQKVTHPSRRRSRPTVTTGRMSSSIWTVSVTRAEGETPRCLSDRAAAAFDTQLRSTTAVTIPSSATILHSKGKPASNSNFIRVLNFTNNCVFPREEIIIQDSGKRISKTGVAVLLDRLVILRAPAEAACHTNLLISSIHMTLPCVQRVFFLPGFRRFRIIAVRRSPIVPDTLDCELPDVIPFADHRPAERAFMPAFCALI